MEKLKMTALNTQFWGIYASQRRLEMFENIPSSFQDHPKGFELFNKPASESVRFLSG